MQCQKCEIELCFVVRDQIGLCAQCGEVMVAVSIYKSYYVWTDLYLTLRDHLWDLGELDRADAVMSDAAAQVLHIDWIFEQPWSAQIDSLITGVEAQHKELRGQLKDAAWGYELSAQKAWDGVTREWDDEHQEFDMFESSLEVVRNTAKERWCQRMLWIYRDRQKDVERLQSLVLQDSGLRLVKS